MLYGPRPVNSELDSFHVPENENTFTLTSAVLSFVVSFDFCCGKTLKVQLRQYQLCLSTGFKSFPIEPQQSFALFTKEYGVGLFVASPDSGFDDRP